MVLSVPNRGGTVEAGLQRRERAAEVRRTNAGDPIRKFRILTLAALSLWCSGPAATLPGDFGL